MMKSSADPVNQFYVYADQISGSPAATLITSHRFSAPSTLISFQQSSRSHSALRRICSQ